MPCIGGMMVGSCNTGSASEGLFEDLEGRELL